jgi:hypothetical protein
MQHFTLKVILVTKKKRMARAPIAKTIDVF